jgi:3-hydroxy-3-methylglutaryl CoA synthase
MIMRPSQEVGIVGYGAYVPRYRLPATEIGHIWGSSEGGYPVKEKSVPGLDEDTTTMAIEAARNALKRAGIAAHELRAVWVGTESKSYAVKPTGTIVAEALGATPFTQAADWEFACKAGTEALQAALGLVGSGMARYALVVGMDAAQGRPGDALEFTAGAGGAAYVLASRPTLSTSPTPPSNCCTSWGARPRTMRPASSTSPTPSSRNAWPRCWGSRPSRSLRGFWCQRSATPTRAHRSWA